MFISWSLHHWQPGPFHSGFVSRPVPRSVTWREGGWGEGRAMFSQPSGWFNDYDILIASGDYHQKFLLRVLALKNIHTKWMVGRIYMTKVVPYV